MAITSLYKYSRAFLFLSIAVFIFSLTQKCFCTTRNCADSAAALISGSVGLITGGAAVTWLANPALITAWLYFNKNSKISLAASTFAVVISLSFLGFKQIAVDDVGSIKEIISYKTGYWLWVTSCVIMLGGNLWNYKLKT